MGTIITTGLIKQMTKQTTFFCILGNASEKSESAQQILNRLENQKKRALKECKKRSAININRKYFRQILLTEYFRRIDVSAWELEDIESGGFYHLQ